MTSKKYTVGRGDVDIVLDDSSISAKHMTIEIRSATEILITDNDSTNGTFLVGMQGKRKLDKAIISPTAHIEIGKYRTTVSNLINEINKIENEEKKPINTNQQPFSRYVRDSGGQLRKKNDK